mmetsp:Transcript_26036/g.61153  ORF Transcript_26036/g.61153 Transcript_26036/m.61153 type:complete len:361 (-) Transcript_26036:1238-2320(-)
MISDSALIVREVSCKSTIASLARSSLSTVAFVASMTLTVAFRLTLISLKDALPAVICPVIDPELAFRVPRVVVPYTLAVESTIRLEAWALPFTITSPSKVCVPDVRIPSTCRSRCTRALPSTLSNSGEYIEVELVTLLVSPEIVAPLRQYRRPLIVVSSSTFKVSRLVFPATSRFLSSCRSLKNLTSTPLRNSIAALFESSSSPSMTRSPSTVSFTFPILISPRKFDSSLDSSLPSITSAAPSSTVISLPSKKSTSDSITMVGLCSNRTFTRLDTTKSTGSPLLGPRTWLSTRVTNLPSLPLSSRGVSSRTTFDLSMLTSTPLVKNTEEESPYHWTFVFLPYETDESRTLVVEPVNETSV